MQFDTLGREFGPGSGKQLRSFRKWLDLLGIELEEVQQVTKISPQILRSIENESFQLLPDIVYVKGFVRTCLRYYKIPNKEEFEKLFHGAIQKLETNVEPVKIIYDQDSSVRVDQFLSQHYEISRAESKALIKNGFVKAERQENKAK